ncbi:hypothetical protein SD81_025870 [Tolypothrix campylonemoides VB511288]|nr:hypothetical protein SD81_025870 [Tolypothrix campylonemoides VB511288]
MGIKFQAIGSLLVLLATISFPVVGAAQTQTLNYETPNEVFERAFFRNDPNFNGSQTLKSQINEILGFGSIFRNSFPENKIARDAELVNIVYRDVLNQQVGHDRYIRTRDLTNPYDSSLLTSPRMNPNQPKVGTQFQFEAAPPR